MNEQFIVRKHYRGEVIDTHYLDKQSVSMLLGYVDAVEVVFLLSLYDNCNSMIVTKYIGPRENGVGWSLKLDEAKQ